jgi:hypothetical protein
MDELDCSGVATPIAQLSPDLPTQNTRTVHGEVTITWPFSAAKQTFAFLLAERDVRLRRVKGLVRVQLHGASAQAVADLGLGGGDEITLSLSGAEWTQDDTVPRSQVSRLEWQLNFSSRLLLQVGSHLKTRVVSLKALLTLSYNR